jgi:prevent-host-death family protein
MEGKMEAVGIKTLKAQLSKYVAKARSGERIIITDRGEEVAELGPLSPTRQAVQALAHRGQLQWNGTKPTGLKGVRVGGDTVAETVIEDRR